MKKLSQTLRAYNSQWTILLKFGMWDAEGGGRSHYENNLSSTREHGATYNRVLVLSVNILMVWHAGFTWPHDDTNYL